MVERLNSAVRSALAEPAVRRQFADQGQEIPAPEQQTLKLSEHTSRPKSKSGGQLLKLPGSRLIRSGSVTANARSSLSR